jgi:hypothetical protein
MLFSHLKRSAKSRGFEFSLSFKTFIKLSESPCTYCGALPYHKQYVNKNGDIWVHGGIDRIDSKRGYVNGNCAPCCEICNIMKAKLTQKGFYDHVEKIMNHQRAPATIGPSQGDSSPSPSPGPPPGLSPVPEPVPVP